jgi:hypothetical protein
MTWFRSHRRIVTRLAALVLVLQSLSMLVAASAHAAAAADGSNLTVVCTAQGLKVMDLSAPDREPVPLGDHQCPLCVAGCAGSCAVSIAPSVVHVTAIVFEPESQRSTPLAVAETRPPHPRLALKSTNPRGPPALA